MSGHPQTGRSLQRAATTQRLELPGDLVVAALTALAGADTTVDVANACLPLVMELPGVRATAVVQRVGRDVVVVGSAGYDCGMMAPGAPLPLDAGLPVTEAVRTGQPVTMGPGPGWIAAPFGWGTDVSGGFLLSLDVAPPDEPAVVERFSQLARGIGAALRRTVARERADSEAALVTSLLAPDDVAAVFHESATRRLPLDGMVGGDVVLCLDEGGAAWLVAADVCGSGLPAAMVASAVRTAVHTALPNVDGPAQLLHAVDAGVRPAVGSDSFVTAAVVRLAHGIAHVASAGHPLPVLLGPDGPVPLAVDPAPPLALDAPGVTSIAEATWPVPPGSVLLLHTDGLTDRRTADGVRMLEPTALCAGIDTTSLGEAADALLAAADAVAPASDDVSLLLVRAARR